MRKRKPVPIPAHIVSAPMKRRRGRALMRNLKRGSADAIGRVLGAKKRDDGDAE